jgi:choline oxidase
MLRTSTQFWEIGLFARTEDGLDRPDLMMHYGSVPFDMNTARRGHATTENGFCLTPNVCRGRSRGTVRLRSRDYRDRARVDPRYFTDPEGHDERVMAHGFRLARKIVSQPAMAAWAGRELAPGPDAQTGDELIDYMHKTHNTVYHPARRHAWARTPTRWRSSILSCGCVVCAPSGSPTGRFSRSCPRSIRASPR